MKKLVSMLSTIFCFLLPGCKDSRTEEHKNKKPIIDLQSFFDGTVKGYGSFFDWRGRQTESFTITMIGDFKDSKGTLSEHFIFSNGSILNREWHVTFHEDKTYSATASDIIGVAHGRQAGNAAYTEYTITVPYKNSSINVSMDDWCYQIDEKTVLNKASMKKFGIKVAELIISLQKE